MRTRRRRWAASEKVTDQPSLEGRIDKGGHHVTGQQLGNMGNLEGLPPLTEQEKRNRGLSEPPKDGEAAWRGPGVMAKPTERDESEKMRHDIGVDDRSRPSGTDMETRPSHA